MKLGLVLSIACVFLALLPFAACSTGGGRAPVAPQKPYVVKSPQGDRTDEYYWVRDDNPNEKRPEVMDYIAAEQAYTNAYLARLEPLQDKLVREMRSRIKEDDSSAPAYDRGYWYWQSFTPGAEYPVYMRQAGTMRARDAAAPVETLLDCPALAKGEDYFAIGDTAVSNDGRWLAWTQDVTGRRIHTLHVKNLVTGEVLEDAIPGVLENVEWSADSATVFYIKQDPVLLQSGPVYRHRLGTPASMDVLVYDEPDKTLTAGIRASASREFLLIDLEGYDTNELRAVPMLHPEQAATVVLPRVAGVRNYADHLRGRWIIRTNENARNFRLVSASEASPADRAAWRELVPHRTDAAIDGVSLFEGAIVLAERVEANARVRVIPWVGGEGFVVPAPEAAYTMNLGDNPDSWNTSVRVVYTSMVTPRTTIDVDLATGARTVRKIQPVLGYDASKYASVRVWAPSRDGKRIPVSISWRRDAYAQDGAHPLVIDGYGSYGIPTDAEFSSSMVSMMDRGVAIALAHVRGGGDLGQDWYEDGRLMHKQNTFNDFVDATDFLVAEKWGAKDKVFATGASAGGLLMGAIANQAGDRYRAISLGVPFVDALTTMLDETIPLTTNEWTQWGDPREKAAYDYIRSYSPYDNLEAKAYPAMIVSTGLWDSQVQYYEPVKYVARCRRLRTDANPLILHVNMGAGHGGSSGRFEHLKDVARQQAFFLDLAGIAD